MDVNKAVLTFRAIGDDTRLKIMKLLLENDLCVGALARMLEISKPAVSQHLKVLREAGLVKGDKRGYWTHYEVNRSSLRDAVCYLQGMAESEGSAAYVCLRTKDRNYDMEMERRVLAMCKDCCEQPAKLKMKPQQCTPEQIKECHGDEKEHPCEKEKEE